MLYETHSRTGGLERLTYCSNCSDQRTRRVVESAVAVVFLVDLHELDGPSRGEARIALARQVSMYLLNCAFQISHTQIGRIYGRDRTTVRHACAVIEDRRDEPMFDRTLSNLEEIVRRLASVTGVSRRGEP